MDANSDTQGTMQGATHGATQGGTRLGDLAGHATGHGTRDTYWQSRVNRPVHEILNSADVANLAADTNLATLTPVDGIEKALNAYRGSGDPDALVLIATFARAEFEHPTAGHTQATQASTSRR